MMDDQDVVMAEYLNGLLSSWHVWSACFAYAQGYASTSATTRMCRCSRQYDDQNGSLDAHIDNVMMQAVDAVVQDIAQPYRTALMIQARNLAVGVSVWASPRLPACPAQRAMILMDAIKIFNAALAKRDLI